MNKLMSEKNNLISLLTFEWRGYISREWESVFTSEIQVHTVSELWCVQYTVKNVYLQHCLPQPDMAEILLERM